MKMITLSDNQGKYILTDEPLGYLWKDYDDYHFTNQDNLGLGYGRMKKMGIPKTEQYHFTFYRIPVKSKREKPEFLVLLFDTNGIYTGIRASGRFYERELKEIEIKAILDLINMGLIKELWLNCIFNFKTI